MDPEDQKIEEVTKAIRKAEAFERRNRILMWGIGLALFASGFYFSSARGDDANFKDLFARALLVVALMLALTIKLVLYKIGRNTRLLLQSIGVVQRRMGVSRELLGREG